MLLNPKTWYEICYHHLIVRKVRWWGGVHITEGGGVISRRYHITEGIMSPCAEIKLGKKLLATVVRPAGKFKNILAQIKLCKKGICSE